MFFVLSIATWLMMMIIINHLKIKKTTVFLIWLNSVQLFVHFIQKIGGPLALALSLSRFLTCDHYTLTNNNNNNNDISNICLAF